MKICYFEQRSTFLNTMTCRRNCKRTSLELKENPDLHLNFRGNLNISLWLNFLLSKILKKQAVSGCLSGRLNQAFIETNHSLNSPILAW